MRLAIAALLVVVCLMARQQGAVAFAPKPTTATSRSLISSNTRLLAILTDPPSKSQRQSTDERTSTPSLEETTEKYGLEVGLFQSLRQGAGKNGDPKDGQESAKSLLKKYGIAYLATSIPLALVSFALCYTLVDMGVDVAGLLRSVGVETTSDLSEKAGTAAIAYAAHKAASPLRFPPTVLLTPVVAKFIGKEENTEDSETAAP